MAGQADSYQHPLPQPPNQYQQPYSHPDQGYHQQEQQQSPVQQYYHPAIASQQQQQQQLPRQQSSQQQYQQQEAQAPPQPALPRPTHQRSSHSKSRTFSFQSQKSHKSSGSKDNIYHETHEEKEAKRLHSKADPSLAISEDEPCSYILSSR